MARRNLVKVIENKISKKSKKFLTKLKKYDILIESLTWRQIKSSLITEQ